MIFDEIKSIYINLCFTFKFFNILQNLLLIFCLYFALYVPQCERDR